MAAPDFLAVVDTEEGRIVHELPMPNVGDELHHFGWNRCSSACHGPDRSHLIVPGFRSSRIHIVNVADDPRRPRIEKVIEPEQIVAATGYTRPHTVHCMPGENVVLAMTSSGSITFSMEGFRGSSATFTMWMRDERKPGTIRCERSGPWQAEEHRFHPKWWSSSPT